MKSLGESLTVGEVAQVLPLATDAHALLTHLRWGRRPRCPYCGSQAHSPLAGGVRYHCNGCATTYSATVGTIMHGSHADLRQWFAAGSTYLTQTPVTVRGLAHLVGVNKNTAARMLRTFGAADPSTHRLLLAIDDRLRFLLAQRAEDPEWA